MLRSIFLRTFDNLFPPVSATNSLDQANQRFLDIINREFAEGHLTSAEHDFFLNDRVPGIHTSGSTLLHVFLKTPIQKIDREMLNCFARFLSEDAIPELKGKEQLRTSLLDAVNSAWVRHYSNDTREHRIDSEMCRSINFNKQWQESLEAWHANLSLLSPTENFLEMVEHEAPENLNRFTL